MDNLKNKYSSFILLQIRFFFNAIRERLVSLSVPEHLFCILLLQKLQFAEELTIGMFQINSLNSIK